MGWISRGGPAAVAAAMAMAAGAGATTAAAVTGEVAGWHSAESHEIISIPGPGPNLRAVDCNWRAAPENPGSPVHRGVPPPAADAIEHAGGPVITWIRLAIT
jgi:hypothetical protein